MQKNTESNQILEYNQRTILTKEEKKIIRANFLIPEQESSDFFDTTSINVDNIEIISELVRVLVYASTQNRIFFQILNYGKEFKFSSALKKDHPYVKKNNSEQIVLVDAFWITMYDVAVSYFENMYNQDLFDKSMKAPDNVTIEALVVFTSYFIFLKTNDISWMVDCLNQERLNRFVKKSKNSVLFFCGFFNQKNIQCSESVYYDCSDDEFGAYCISDSPVPIKNYHFLEMGVLCLLHNDDIQVFNVIFPWSQVAVEIVSRENIDLEKIKAAFQTVKESSNAIINEPQERFVLEKAPILAIAGPGAGKTTTLIRKIEHEMKSRDINSMLILTFTNKAAAELKERLIKRINSQIEPEFIGTFHSVFYKLIKRAIFSKWSIILPYDDDELFLGILAKSLSCSKKEAPGTAELVYGAKIGDLKGSISRAIFSCKYLSDDIVMFCEGLYSSDFAKVVKKYLSQKEKMCVMNFDDVLRYTLQSLIQNSVWRESIREHFGLIMVDEFQDTNKIQFAILSYISTGSNVIAVGDPYQSIYAFMNARIENVFDFNSEYKPNVIQMLLNYRSTNNIVALTNEITKYFSTQISGDKIVLKPTKAATPVFGRKTTIYPAEFREKSTFELIQQDINNGIHPGEIAVITRLNRDSSKLEKLLTKASIPFKKKGGASFFEKKESQIILNALRFYIDRYALSSFYSIAIFMDNVGEETVESIIDIASSLGSSVDSSLIYNQDKSLKFKRKKEILSMLAVFEKNTEPNYDDFIKVLDELKISDLLAKELKTKADIEDLRENIAELLEDARSVFSAEDIHEATDDLMAMLMSKSSSRGEGKAVTITTAHSAKGLEWSKVYLMDISAGTFTQCRLDMFELTDEQIRLLYVAVSRAKDELVLMYQHTSLTGGKRKRLDVIIEAIWKNNGTDLFRVPEKLLKWLPTPDL